jgi:hypothetical protein
MSAKTFADSVTQAFTAAAAEVPLTMRPGTEYRVYCTTDAWIRLVKPGEATNVAVKGGPGSHPIKAFADEIVSALGPGTRISVIQDTAGGNLTLSEIARSIGP